MGGAGPGTPDFGKRPGGAGGSAGGGGGGGQQGDDICATFTAIAHLASPKRDVLKKLKKGERLQVELGENNSQVLALTKDGNLAGVLMPTSLSTLAKCLTNGYSYHAVVLSVSGGACEVEVRPGRPS